MIFFEKINWSLVIGILGGVLAICAAIAQWQEANKQEAKADENQKTISSKQDSIEKLQIENKTQTDKLLKAYAEIATLNKDIKNQITGGGMTPKLKIEAFKVKQTETSLQYYLISFSLVDPGDYPIQNIRGIIGDFHSLGAMKIGKKVVLQANSGSITGATQDDIDNYSPLHPFDIGTITKGTDYRVHMGLVLLEPTGLLSGIIENEFGYNIQFQWNGGNLTFYLNLKFEGDKIKALKSTEVVFDGVKQSKPTKYYEYSFHE